MANAYVLRKDLIARHHGEETPRRSSRNGTRFSKKGGLLGISDKIYSKSNRAIYRR